MTIAVTGSTGQLGRHVIEGLKEQIDASEIVAIARNASKATDLGVTVREADYGSVPALESALRGIETLLLISSSEVGQRSAQHRNVIAAARAAGVSRIVYISLLRADTSELSLADEHVETEADLKASGLNYTILRNGWYTENYTGSIAPALANGAFVGSAGQGRISSAPRADYAAAAVAVVTTPGHDGKTYELSGDESYTLDDLAAEISRQTGKTIPYTDLPEADYAGILKSIGMSESFAEAIANWDVAASKGALEGSDKTLSGLIGRPTTNLAEAVKASLAV